MEQNVQRHIGYMLQLSEQKILIVGGGLDTTTPHNPGEYASVGQIVISAENLNEALQIVQNDPAITDRLCELKEIHQWVPLINNWTGENLLLNPGPAN
jgi:uncharacterized protein YciI